MLPMWSSANLRMLAATHHSGGNTHAPVATIARLAAGAVAAAAASAVMVPPGPAPDDLASCSCACWRGPPLGWATATTWALRVASWPVLLL